MTNNLACASLVCACLAAPATAATLTDRFSSLWVFGDSLSDPGNLYAATGGTTPASYFEPGGQTVETPYFRGRFSDGFVFADYLTQGFEAAGLAFGNYAYGGARAVPNGTGPDADTIPDLPDQIAMFAADGAGRLGDRPLAQVLFGGNDIFAAALSDDPAGRARTAAAATVAGLEQLYGLGIRDFAVGNVADVGTTPLYNLFAPSLRDEAEIAVAAFNAKLMEDLSALVLPGSRTTFVDRFDFYDAFQQTAERIGITELTLPCLFPSDEAAAAAGQPRLCDDPDRHFFFDQVHPGGKVHAVYAQQVTEEILAPVPLPAGGVLLLSGFCLLAGHRRVRAA